MKTSQVDGSDYLAGTKRVGENIISTKIERFRPQRLVSGLARQNQRWWIQHCFSAYEQILPRVDTEDTSAKDDSVLSLFERGKRSGQRLRPGQVPPCF